MNGIDIGWLCIGEETSLVEVLRRHAGAMDHGQPAGIALVVDKQSRLVGSVTDGDVRRALLQRGTLDITAGMAMTRDPITFPSTWTFRQILEALPDELTRRGRRDRRFLGKVILTDPAKRPVRVVDYHQLWEQRVATHRQVVVLGMGYVGLTLGLGLADEGFNVTGVDVDATKVEGLSKGISHVHEIGLPELLRKKIGKSFHVSREVPNHGEVFVIAVGTPVKNGVPQLDALRESIDMVAARMQPGALVVLRSTVPAGTTRSFVLPRLEEKTGLKGGLDFHLAFAPERTVEGKALSELRTLPQVIGGLTEDSVEATVALFRELTPTIVRVESLEAAELIKLVNNGFRDLIFAFSNEVSKVCSQFNLDSVEVIRAANRGYVRDPVPLPSPGVGGPCLTKDPYIFAAVARGAGVDDTLFAHGRRVNESMQAMIVQSILDELVRQGRKLKDATVVVAGLAFKGEPETADMRNSPGEEIAALLKAKVGRLLAHDPVVPHEELRQAGYEPVSLPEGAAGADAVVVLNNHRFYAKLDVGMLVRSMKQPAIVYDGWHQFRPHDVLTAGGGVYMGIGFVRRAEGTPA